jgi:hypothetical protein
MNTFLERLGHIAQIAVALCVIAAFFACIACFFWLTFQGRDLLPGLKEVLLVLIGVLAGAFKDVIGFYLGSSLSSAKKDSLLAAKPPV